MTKREILSAAHRQAKRMQSTTLSYHEALKLAMRKAWELRNNSGRNAQGFSCLALRTYYLDDTKEPIEEDDFDADIENLDFTMVK